MPTLQELLALAQGGDQMTRPGQGNLLAALGPAVGGGGSTAPSNNPLDSQIQDQISALSQPEPVADIPVGPQTKLWQRLLAGVADAGSVYARGMNPYIPTTNALGGLMAQDERNKNAAAVNLQRRGDATAKGKRTKAELELQRLLKEKDTQAANQERKDVLSLQNKYRAEADAREAQAILDKQAFEAAQAVKHEKFLAGQAELNRAHDQAMERIHERQRQGDKVAATDDKKIEAGKAYTATLADNFDAIIKTDADWDAATTRARRFFDQQNMSKDGRAVVDAYFQQEMNALREDKMNREMAAGSPMQPPPPTDAEAEMMRLRGEYAKGHPSEALSVPSDFRIKPGQRPYQRLRGK